MDKLIEKDSVDNFSNGLMESKTSNLDDLLKEKLENAFHKQTYQIDTHNIAKIAVEHSPIDLAYAVIHLPASARSVLYDNLPTRDDKIKFVINTDSDTRIQIFRYMNDWEMKKLFEKMSTDEAVEILEDLSERRYRRVMEIIDPKKAMRINELKKHNRNSAGRLMTSEFFAFSMDMKIKDVAIYIKNNPGVDVMKGVYLLNEKKQLQGYVPGRNLIINSYNTPLRQVMRPVLHYVGVDASREEVVDLVERYKLSSLPVVNEENHLVGVIAHEDVLEAMEDLADEKIAKIGGTIEKVSLVEPILKRFIARSPWLLVTLIAGLVNVGVMSAFQKQEGGMLTFVLFFVPLITGMSGNIGIQCSTVLIRSMAMGSLSSGHRKEALLKELSIGVFSGIIFSFGVGLTVFFIDLIFAQGMGISPFALGMIVGMGLLGACVAGTFLGVMSPLFFARIGIDPAIASGPIVTAFNDFLSMSMYFLIAWGLGVVFLG